VTDKHPQTPHASDPFKQLEVARGFELDPAGIDRAFLKRAAMAHPDVSGLDVEDAARVQAELNDARATLIDPERRANVLLALLGGASKEQDKSLPAGFLVQMMETREEIEAAMTDVARHSYWVQWAQEQRAHYMAKVGPLFARAIGGDAAVLPDIRRELNAWRYIERLVEQLEPGFDPGRTEFRG
jgi:DnaJ-domain-containing protein 1